MALEDERPIPFRVAELITTPSSLPGLVRLHERTVARERAARAFALLPAGPAQHAQRHLSSGS